MGRPRGTKNNPVQERKEAVRSTERDAVKEAAAVVEQKPEIAPFDTCRYHEDCRDGRVFKGGEVIPAGWVDTPAKLTKKETAQ